MLSRRALRVTSSHFSATVLSRSRERHFPAVLAGRTVEVPQTVLVSVDVPVNVIFQQFSPGEQWKCRRQSSFRLTSL